jgi:hypothetical protein
VVAPIAAPVAPTHVVKKHKRKRANHRALAARMKQEGAATVEPAKSEVNVEGKADTPAR